MSLTISSPITALACNSSINVKASGGTPPYTYTLVNGDYSAGGTLTPLEDGSVTYTAPAYLVRPDDCIAEIMVTDAAEQTALMQQLIVGKHLTILCDIIAHQCNLFGRVHFVNQRFEWPKGPEMFVVVEQEDTPPMSKTVEHQITDGHYYEIATMLANATVSINMYSRGTEARDRKEEILLALSSAYSQGQQIRNNIKIGELPNSGSIRYLPEIDGDASLYRYQFTIKLMYQTQVKSEIDYFGDYRLEDKVNNA